MLERDRSTVVPEVRPPYRQQPSPITTAAQPTLAFGRDGHQDPWPQTLALARGR